MLLTGFVRRLRESVDSGRSAVQDPVVRADRDAGQHDVPPDGDEFRPVLGDMSAARLVATEGDDCCLVAAGVRLCHTAAAHLHAGYCSISVLFSGNCLCYIFIRVSFELQLSMMRIGK